MMIAVHCPSAAQTEPVSASGRTIYTAPECLNDAKRLFTEIGALTEVPELQEPAETSLLWRLGLQKAEESAREVRERSAHAAERLLSTGLDCVVLAPPRLLHFLLRALEQRGCVIRRSGSGAIHPGEHIRVTERADHCGGCQHNCLLKNPGCGIGRDKAARGC